MKSFDTIAKASKVSLTLGLTAFIAGGYGGFLAAEAVNARYAFTGIANLLVFVVGMLLCAWLASRITVAIVGACYAGKVMDGMKENVKAPFRGDDQFSKMRKKHFGGRDPFNNDFFRRKR